MGLCIFWQANFHHPIYIWDTRIFEPKDQNPYGGKKLLNYTNRDILKFINLLTAVEKIIVWAQNVSVQLNFKNLRFKWFRFVLNCSLMLISLTELQHLKNLLKKTPYFKERRRESRKKKEDRNDGVPKFAPYKKLGRVQQITVKTDCRVQNWIAKKGTLQKKDHT